MILEIVVEILVILVSVICLLLFCVVEIQNILETPSDIESCTTDISDYKDHLESDQDALDFEIIEQEDIKQQMNAEFEHIQHSDFPCNYEK